MHARTESERTLEGIVVVDKPTGLTSHDVVSRVRRRFKMRRVGHAGTLDPLATGVLVVLVGKATRLFGRFEAFDKAYKATLILGRRTTTADVEGRIVSESPWGEVTRERLEEVFREFTGRIEQIPPMVSAVKVKGKRLYTLARKGLEVRREARKITIHSLEILEFSPPEVRFTLECSKGTYVRKLAEDIGERLGCGACISEIQRTKVGPFTIDQAVRLEDLDESCLRPWTGVGG